MKNPRTGVTTVYKSEDGTVYDSRDGWRTAWDAAGPPRGILRADVGRRPVTSVRGVNHG